MVQAGVYGDTYRIQIKKNEQELAEAEGNPSIYTPHIYTLNTVQQSKYNKEEKKFILREALALMKLQESASVSKMEYMYKTANTFFYITKEPICSINGALMAKIQASRQLYEAESIKLTQRIEQAEQILVPPRPPNLFEYLIERGQALNLGDVQVIARDLLYTLH